MIYFESFYIQNLGPFGVQEFRFGPGVNVIAGNHAVGKTTCIRGLELFLQGGSDYTLIRHGETHAEGRMRWSDGFEIFKAMDIATEVGKRDEYTTEVKGPSGEVKKRYAEAIAERVPKASFSPSAFLALAPKDRADFLVNRLNVRFPAAAINQALRTQPGTLAIAEVVMPPVDKDLDIKGFTELYDTIYELRRQVNVLARDKQGTIEQLRSTLPVDDDGTDWNAEAELLQHDLSTRKAERASAVEKIHLEAQAARSERRMVVESERTKLKQVSDSFLARLSSFRSDCTAFAMLDSESADRPAPALIEQSELDDFCLAVRRRAALGDELKQFLAATELAEKQAIDEQSEADAMIELLSTSYGEARARANSHAAAAGSRRAIAKMEEECTGLVTKELHRTAILEALERLKHMELSKLPIDGLEIRFVKKQPTITVHGTPVERLSGKEAMFFGMQCLVHLAAGKHPLIIDEGDGLTVEAITMLHNECMLADPPIQVIFARHSEGGELRVVRYGEGESL